MLQWLAALGQVGEPIGTFHPKDVPAVRLPSLGITCLPASWRRARVLSPKSDCSRQRLFQHPRHARTRLRATAELLSEALASIVWYYQHSKNL
jgi:hypothetical protein